MRFVVLVLVPALAACSSSPARAPTEPVSATAAPVPAVASLDVPFKTAPTVDGTIDASEWAGAASATVGDLRLRFVHDRARVYIAVERPQPMGFACVLVAADPTTVRVLHASAKLGSATYRATQDGTFDPVSKEYVWRAAEDMRAAEGWLATTMKPGAAPAQELAIDFATLGLPASGRPIAISFFHTAPDAKDLSAASTLVWPSGLTDDAANVQLVAGFNPDALRFELARWITLVPR